MIFEDGDIQKPSVFENNYMQNDCLPVWDTLFLRAVACETEVFESGDTQDPFIFEDSYMQRDCLPMWETYCLMTVACKTMIFEDRGDTQKPSAFENARAKRLFTKEGKHCFRKQLHAKRRFSEAETPKAVSFLNTITCKTIAYQGGSHVL